LKRGGGTNSAGVPENTAAKPAPWKRRQRQRRRRRRTREGTAEDRETASRGGTGAETETPDSEQGSRDVRENTKVDTKELERTTGGIARKESAVKIRQWWSMQHRKSGSNRRGRTAARGSTSVARYGISLSINYTIKMPYSRFVNRNISIPSRATLFSATPEKVVAPEI